MQSFNQFENIEKKGVKGRNLNYIESKNASALYNINSGIHVYKEFIRYRLTREQSRISVLSL